MFCKPEPCDHTFLQVSLAIMLRGFRFLFPFEDLFPLQPIWAIPNPQNCGCFPFLGHPKPNFPCFLFPNSMAHENLSLSVVPFYTFGGEGSPAIIDCTKKGTLIRTPLLQDLGGFPGFCFNPPTQPPPWPWEALHVFRDMRAAGQSADTRACTSLVSGLVRMGQLKEAVQATRLRCGAGLWITWGLSNLGPPARCPFALFWGEGSPTKVDYTSPLEDLDNMGSEPGCGSLARLMHGYSGVQFTCPQTRWDWSAGFFISSS